MATRRKFLSGSSLVQDWLFRNQPQFWDPKSVAAFLSGIPDDRMILIDYSSDSKAGEISRCVAELPP